MLVLLCLLAAGSMGESCQTDPPAPAPSPRGSAALQEQLDQLAALVVPAGAVLPFAGPPEASPAGFLPCDGSAVSRSEFADLFAEIGTAHGGGDGSTTFHLPDYRGRLLRGVDQAAGRDPESASRTAMAAGGNTGNAVGSVQGHATAVPAAALALDDSSNPDHVHTHVIGTEAWQHSHVVSAPGGVVTVDAASKGDWDGEPPVTGIGAIEPAGSHAHNVGAGGAHAHGVGGGDPETAPVNAYVSWIIKY